MHDFEVFHSRSEYNWAQDEFLRGEREHPKNFLLVRDRILHMDGEVWCDMPIFSQPAKVVAWVEEVAESHEEDDEDFAEEVRSFSEKMQKTEPGEWADEFAQNGDWEFFVGKTVAYEHEGKWFVLKGE